MWADERELNERSRHEGLERQLKQVQEQVQEHIQRIQTGLETKAMEPSAGQEADPRDVCVPQTDGNSRNVSNNHPFC